MRKEPCKRINPSGQTKAGWNRPEKALSIFITGKIVFSGPVIIISKTGSWRIYLPWDTVNRKKTPGSRSREVWGNYKSVFRQIKLHNTALKPGTQAERSAGGTKNFIRMKS